MTREIGIRTEVSKQWADLTAKLDEMADRGQQTPCQSDPEPYFSDASSERREACQACTWCPARGACAAFAVANAEQAGVWAGTDRQLTSKAKAGQEGGRC
ncbi:WhiB family transcriptional regulator [Nocardioides sp. AE5]|uniref:WhiB family transcriptional regulator n=1 Tax=Nocardioides sp. AE5 TaxID=2962573 RepID=UPI002880CD37|nr:WhiB family transcriptional regulator [Nocardioides sp. AE5]MDT0201347.1 WhiB family transcriptional regulator [Nocardioides sp. AE5]